jgi:hypothetical protein
MDLNEDSRWYNYRNRYKYNCIRYSSWYIHFYSNKFFRMYFSDIRKYSYRYTAFDAGCTDDRNYNSANLLSGYRYYNNTRVAFIRFMDFNKKSGRNNYNRNRDQHHNFGSGKRDLYFHSD